MTHKERGDDGARGATRAIRAIRAIVGLALAVALCPGARGGLTALSLPSGQPRSRGGVPSEVRRSGGATQPQSQGVHSAAIRTMTIPIGQNPVTVVADGQTGRAFVVVQGADDRYGEPGGNGRVYVVDTQTGRIVRSVAVGLAPDAMALDERAGRLFVANYSTRSVSVLDAGSGRVLRTVRVGPGPQALAVDARAGRVLVGDEGVTDSANTPLGGGSVTAVEARSGNVMYTAALGASPSAIALDPRQGRAFVLDAEGDLSILAAGSGTVLRTIMGPSFSAVAVDGQTGRIFLLQQPSYAQATANPAPAHALTLASASGKAVRTVPLPGSPVGLAVDEGRDRVFVTAAGYGNGASVSVLDAATGRLLRTVTVALATGREIAPVAPALDTRRGRLYIAASASRGSGLHVLDARTGAPVRTIPIRGDVVKALAVDEQSGHVFVVSTYSSPPARAGQGVLTMIDGAP